MDDTKIKENVHKGKCDEGEEMAKNAVLVPSTSLPADTPTVKGLYFYIFFQKSSYCYYYYISNNNNKIF